MRNRKGIFGHRWIALAAVTLCGALLLAAVLLGARIASRVAYAGPIPPPEGRPKLTLSLKTVTPTLISTGGMTLTYEIEVRNTGAYATTGATLTDHIPDATTYNGDAQASEGLPEFDAGSSTLRWVGDVGFDSTITIRFSVRVAPAFSGTVRNTAVISHPLLAGPVTVTAEAVVTDQPILAIEKTSAPDKPGPGKPLTYTLVVANLGQPAADLPVTVVDAVPPNTSLGDVGTDGVPGGDIVTWTRRVTLGLGERTVFTFSVDVDAVPSGTVLANADYWVTSPEIGTAYGEPYTVTVVDPILSTSKHVWPDPPGSNREMTYTLTVFNAGSLAQGLIVTDRVPSGVTYQRGGSETGGVVSWSLPSLDTAEAVDLTYTVYVSDVMNVAVVNDNYGVCCDEGVCQEGSTLTNVVRGPVFQSSVNLDPIAKGPGGGNKPVTPTLVVRNLGPGNARDAVAVLFFYQISVQESDLYADPPIGTFQAPVSCSEGDLKCEYFVWQGNLDYGQAVTFTTYTGQNTINPVPYTATVVITDSLGNAVTDPVTGTASGQVMHRASLGPLKSAPPVVGRGRLLTYTISVWNSGLSTEEPPTPWLLDYVPLSTTVVHISDGGVSRTLTGTTILSWTLPSMSTGERTERSFTVGVHDDLVSGTQIVNEEYAAYWVSKGTIYSNTGQAVTTTVRDVGLIDSYKEVLPLVASPGDVLTYVLHIVNSSAIDLNGVEVDDVLPWEASTYQRDAVASAGKVTSDIVSLRWEGSVAALSSETVTLTVRIDPDYRGALTNTAKIQHPDLLNEVEVQAVAYSADTPAFRVLKLASPDRVEEGDELVYTIRVINLGQRATNLLVTDTLPANVEYVPGSTTGGGELVGDLLRWTIPVLEPGESRTIGFRVTVLWGSWVVNDRYAVRCAEGVIGVGAPVVTPVGDDAGQIYLPLVLRGGP